MTDPRVTLKRLRWAFSALFILFLLVLVWKFRPRVEVPTPAPPPILSGGVKGSLSATGFEFRETSGGKLAYAVTASRVAEAPGGERNLEDPVVTLPGQGKATARLGTFDPATKKLRMWDDARLERNDGWVLTADALRMTPEGEVVTEGPARFSRGADSGASQQARYNRETQRAALEGDVSLSLGGRCIVCQTVNLDLLGHAGTLTGPVVMETSAGRLEAPAGTATLTADNRLETLTLGSPVAGQAGARTLSAETATASFAPAGDVTAVRLAGKVAVNVPGTVPATLRSERVDLFPMKDERWRWISPGPLSVSRADGEAHAPSGSGAFGGKAPETALLAGPVEGRDGKGTFGGDGAELHDGDWVLSGHAFSTRPPDDVKADRITWKADGATVAEGSVRGRRTAPDAPEVRYTADKVRTARDGGYPVRLKGSVHVERASGTLDAPVVTLSGPRTATAEGGAVAVFAAKDGARQTVRGATLVFDGETHAARAEGGASAQGKDYRVDAALLTATLDAQDRPVRYDARGECRFDGANHKGTGERMTYDPASQSGEVFGEGGAADVTQKKPYRRVTGPSVAFGPKRLEVLARTGGLSRGRLEGVPPEKQPRTAEGGGR